MALDGIFLRHIKKEIEEAALGARVSQIYQPNRDELVLVLRFLKGKRHGGPLMVKLNALNMAEQGKINAVAFHGIQKLLFRHIKLQNMSDMGMRVNNHTNTLFLINAILNENA